jgi:hypothetical protein
MALAKKGLRVPHSLLVVLVLIGFAGWVLAPLVIPNMAANAGMSRTTLAALLRVTISVLGIVFVLVMLRIMFSPVHDARGDQPPSRLVAASFSEAPWRRARLASNRELARAWSNRVLRRDDPFNTVRSELNRVYQTNPELALQLYREWAAKRGVSTMPVVTKYGVAGRWVKAVWSEAFASRKLHWLHFLALEAKTGLVKVTNPIVIPPTVLGTRLAFIARPWGGARMARLRHRENVPRGAFVLDLAPILVLAAITALSTGATIALANL